MKRFFLFLLKLVAVWVTCYLCVVSTIAQVTSSKIDRTRGLYYKTAINDKRVSKVFVDIEDGWMYHFVVSGCHFIYAEDLLANYKGYVKMTEAEAIKRGFTKCPDCDRGMGILRYLFEKFD